MPTLYEIIRKLQDTPGSNDKLAILNENVDNAVLKWYLRESLCPSVSFYLTSKTFPVCETVGDNEFMEDASSIFVASLAYSLSERKVSGKMAKERVLQCLESLNKEGQELLRMMLLKDIRAGIGVSTVNKVWPGLCLQVPYQRCSLPTEQALKHFPDGKLSIVQLKGDGMFAAFNRSNGEMTTRKGNKFPSWLGPYLLQHKQELIDEVLEGELLCVRDGKVLPRKEGNGILNSILQGGELPYGVDIEYHVWNSLNVEHWKAGETYIDYDISFGCTIQSVELLGSSRVKVIEHTYVESLEEALTFNDLQLAKGLEGSVLKTLDHKWKSGTSKYCIKLKKTREVDLLWVDSVEGAGKNNGRLGAMVLQSECGALKVKCGTGLSDADRWLFWSNPPDLPCVVTVAASEIIESKGKKEWSLFLPRFIELRGDKDSADDMTRIREIFA